MEEDYISWVEIDGSPLTFTYVEDMVQVAIDEDANFAAIYDRKSSYVATITIEPPTILSEDYAVSTNNYVEQQVTSSILGKYIVIQYGIGEAPTTANIFKDGVLIQSIAAGTEVWISPNGKYIFIFGIKVLHIYKGVVGITEGLTESEQEALNLQRLENFTEEKVAELTGLTISTVTPIEGDYSTWTLKSYCPITGSGATKVLALNEYAVLALSAGNELRKLNYDTGVITSAFGKLVYSLVYLSPFSVTGKYFATTHDNDNIYVYKDGVLQQTITVTGLGEGWISISPNGQYIAIFYGSGLMIYKGSA